MKSFLSILASLSTIYYIVFPQQALARVYDPTQQMMFVRNPVLIAQYQEAEKIAQQAQAALANAKVYKSWRVITAYSSTAYQTDDTPFITASGARVRDGIIAANFLPFGTKVRIPALFGNNIFVVEDRMNERFPTRLDVWFPYTWQARNFGLQVAEIEVLVN